MALMRAQAIHSQVSRLRLGRAAVLPYADKFEAQAAAVEAFLQAARLAPSQGETWYELGTSLFFAGEVATSHSLHPTSQSICSGPVQWHPCPTHGPGGGGGASLRVRPRARAAPRAAPGRAQQGRRLRCGPTPPKDRVRGRGGVYNRSSLANEFPWS